MYWWDVDQPGTKEDIEFWYEQFDNAEVHGGIKFYFDTLDRPGSFATSFYLPPNITLAFHPGGRFILFFIWNQQKRRVSLVDTYYDTYA
jgi:hypothetical protein